MIQLPEDKLETLTATVAATNSPEAFVALGKYWESSDDIFGQNLPEAFDCYRKAKELGSIDAVYRLSRFYRYGDVVEENKDYGFALLKEAAEAGHAEAMRDLADEYLSHENKYFPHNAALAEKLFTEAAEKDPELRSRIAGYYLPRHPVLGLFNVNLDKAEMWIRKGIEGGDPYALDELRELAEKYASGDDNIPYNPQKAAELYREIVAINEADTSEHDEFSAIGDGALSLGILYEEGKGVPVDFREAEKYFRMAIAKKGRVTEYAQMRLGHILLHGKPGVPANPEEAADLLWDNPHCSEEDTDILTKRYRVLAKNGDPEAEFRLSEILYRDMQQRRSKLKLSPELDRSYDMDYAKSESAKWAFHASVRGHAEAQYQLYCRLRDLFPKVAGKQLIKAAENGHLDAMDSLAYYYRFGNKKLGIKKDVRAAIPLYEKVLSSNYKYPPYLGLVFCYEKLREWENAVTYLELACEHYRNRKWHYAGFYYLSKYYARGRGVPRDKAFATQLLKIAAQRYDIGSPFDEFNAQIEYADLLWKSSDVPDNKKKAVCLYENQHHTSACARLRLARAYFTGQGVPARDFKEAFSLLKDGLVCYYYRYRRNIIDAVSGIFKKTD